MRLFILTVFTLLSTVYAVDYVYQSPWTAGISFSKANEVGCNGIWSGIASVFDNNTATYSSTTPTASCSEVILSSGFPNIIPSDKITSSVFGIEARIYAATGGTAINNKLNVAIQYLTALPAYRITPTFNTTGWTNPQVIVLGSSSDLWGRASWTPSEVMNNMTLRWFHSAAGSNTLFYANEAAVRVTYGYQVNVISISPNRITAQNGGPMIEVTGTNFQILDGCVPCIKCRIGSEVVPGNILPPQNKIHCPAPPQPSYGVYTVEITLDGVQYTSDGLTITYNCSSSVDCNGRGDCNADGTCLCEVGFNPPDCLPEPTTGVGTTGIPLTTSTPVSSSTTTSTGIPFLTTTNTGVISTTGVVDSTTGFDTGTTGDATTGAGTTGTGTISVGTTGGSFTGAGSITVGATATTSNGADSQLNAESSGGSTSVLGAAIGAAIGGVALIVLIIVFFLVRRRKKKSDSQNKERSETGTHYAHLSSSMDKDSKDKSVEYAPIPMGTIRPPSVASSVVMGTGNRWEISYDDLKIEKEIGRGSFGVVFKAVWRESQVAVKQLSKEKYSQEKDLADFKAEADILMNLRPHNNVVHLQGIVLEPLCIVVEFCVGGSLYTKLFEVNKLIPFAQKVNWLQGIAAGMLHLHREKIIHRDLAARNILLSADQTPKISDFGLSRPVTSETGATTKSDIGPLRWMSPESLLHRTYSTKSDVWSFAVLMYEVLVQKLPYEELDTVQTAAQVIAKTAVLHFPSDCHEGLRDLAKQCLDWEPHNRPDFEFICTQLKTIH